jgi:4'-phosphopantetheinyl transferase
VRFSEREVLCYTESLETPWLQSRFGLERKNMWLGEAFGSRNAESISAPDAIHVWRASLDLLTPCLRQLDDVLAPIEKARADRFIFGRDRDRYVAGRACLKMILGRYLGLDPVNVSLRYGPFGKPSLEGSDLSFNMSGSSGQAVYALGRGRRIGVDIERIRDIDEMDQVAARFFSKPEYEMLCACPSDDRQKTFFEIWTRKEATVKGMGGGLTLPLHVFDVSGDPRQSRHTVKFLDDPGLAPGWVTHDLRLMAGFASALAVEHSDQAFGIACVYSLCLENDRLVAKEGL